MHNHTCPSHHLWACFIIVLTSLVLVLRVRSVFPILTPHFQPQILVINVIMCNDDDRQDRKEDEATQWRPKRELAKVEGGMGMSLKGLTIYHTHFQSLLVCTDLPRAVAKCPQLSQHSSSFSLCLQPSPGCYVNCIYIFSLLFHTVIHNFLHFLWSQTWTCWTWTYRFRCRFRCSQKLPEPAPNWTTDSLAHYVPTIYQSVTDTYTFSLCTAWQSRLWYESNELW